MYLLCFQCRDFVKAGALKGSSPCEVVQQCDITFCCVADTTAVKDVSIIFHLAILLPSC